GRPVGPLLDQRDLGLGQRGFVATPVSVALPSEAIRLAIAVVQNQLMLVLDFDHVPVLTIEAPPGADLMTRQQVKPELFVPCQNQASVTDGREPLFLGARA
ncbi:hypothetical protein K7462_30560, partial [Pseudomonas fluorescens]